MLIKSPLLNEIPSYGKKMDHNLNSKKRINVTNSSSGDTKVRMDY